MSHTYIIEALQDNTIDQLDISEIIDVLETADDLYYNDDTESFLTDEQYDAIRRYAERAYPQHIYFTGIGSDVRGGKVKLPFQLGSLDQVYEGEIVDWIKKNSLQDEDHVLTDKLDGTSALLIYGDDGKLQIAYSRGNGIEGADITRHVRKIPCIPQSIGRPMVVRGEMIFPKEVFEKLKEKVRNRAGKQYKNPRNMVAGVMNAKENPTIVYDDLHFVAYDVISETKAKHKQLQLLTNKGFLTPYWITWTGNTMSDSTLTLHLNTRRKACKYEIDGIVIDVDSADVREKMNPTRATLNPAYAVKYKIADENNQAVTTVSGVDWNLSKHGYWKPRIQFEPVELCGVTISNCTGFNAKFIYDNNISKGAKIRIVRSGDVTPFCQTVVEQSDVWQEPDGDWEWNETGVDAIHPESHNLEVVRINQMIDFFSAIDAPFLKKGNVQKLFEAGFDTIESIIKASERELVSALGENGKKAFEGLRKVLDGIPLYKLMGAYSNERGIGVRRMKMLNDALGENTLRKLTDVSQIASVERFDVKTAEKVIAAVGKFNKFFSTVDNFISFADTSITQSSGSMKGEKVVFTGFRDKQLQEAVEAAGGTMQSSVSSKTTIVVTTNPDSNTGKIKKARDLGIKIIGLDDFKDMV